MKKLMTIYPQLEAQRAYHGETAHDLAVLLGISDEGARRRLRGAVNFELPEIKKIMEHYNCSFEDLFSKINEKVG